MSLLAAVGLSLTCMPIAAAQDSTRCQRTALSIATATEAPTAIERMFNFRAAWPLSTGRDVTVAVIDTGVFDHPRLGGVIDGGDLADGAGALTDCDAHGTFVAGIVAGRPSDDSFSGIAPDARILSIRQTAEGFGDLASLSTAIDLAVEKGARVINISLTSCSPAGAVPVGANEIVGALHRAEEAGAVVVAAAGNAGDSCEEGSIAWPAVLPSVLAVAAVEPDDSGQLLPASYSMTGDWVDLAALGGPVVGPSPYDDALADLHVSPSSRAGSSSGRPIFGTSFATPVVSGTVALLLARDPQLSPADVRTRLLSSATPLSNGLGVGRGLVNPLGAVSWSEADQLAQAEVRPAAAPTPQPISDPRPASRAVGLIILVAVSVPLWLLLRAGRRTNRR
nr:type VII secretion-associated serine protease mycosin [Corynebacterium lactis]